MAVFLAGFAVAQPDAPPEPVEILYVAPEAQALREAVLTWSQSLRSFSGSYELRQRWPYTLAEPDRPPRTYTITYRFDGDNAYMEREFDLDPVGRAHFFMARYRGNATGRFDYFFPEDAEARYGELFPRHNFNNRVFVRQNVGRWPEPEGPFLPPPQVFQAGLWPHSSLAEFMRFGETHLVETGDAPVLVHRQSPAGRNHLVVWFDAQDRVVGFERGIGIIAPMEKIRRHFPEDPLRLFSVSETFDLGGYEEIDGVQFPTWVQQVVWEYPDNGKAEMFRQRYAAGEISYFEWQTHVIQDLGEPYQATILDFELLNMAQPLNSRLRARDFEVPIPRGAYVQGDPGVNALERYRPAWYTYVIQPVPLAVSFVVLVLLGGLWYGSQRRAF